MIEAISQYFFDILHFFEILYPAIMLATLLVIIWYTVETKKMRISNQKTVQFMEEQLRIEKLKNEPNVSAYFDDGINLSSVLLILSNDGNSFAKNVKLKISPKLDFGKKTYNEYFYKSAAINSGVNIPANGKYEILVGSTKIASKLYKDEKISKSYNITLSYYNLANESFVNSVELNIDQFFNRLQIRRITDNLKINSSEAE